MIQFKRLLIYQILILLVVSPTFFSPAAANDDPEIPAKSIFLKKKKSVITFSGNKTISAKKLRQSAKNELADFSKNIQQKNAVDDAAFQMELAYRRAGFPFTEVDYEYRSDDLTAFARFIIREGPKTEVGALRISGNTAFNAATLLAFFDFPTQGLTDPGRLYVDTVVREGISKIRDLYRSEGYLLVSVSSPALVFSEDRASVDIDIAVTEGVRSVLKTVEFHGEILPEAEADLQALKEEFAGKPYFKRRKLGLRNRILEVYGRLGYPSPEIHVQEKESGVPGEIILETSVKSGFPAKIARINVSGNNRTKSDFIKNRIKYKQGDSYDPEKHRDSFQQLYRTGLFAKVDIDLSHMDTPEDGILEVRVEESPARELFFEPGWGSYEWLRMRTGYRDRNLLGTGRIFRAEGGISVKGRDLLISFTDPWFMSTDIVADLPFTYHYREEPSFSREDTGASLLFTKPLSRNWNVSFGSLYRTTDIFDYDAETTPEAFDTGYDIVSAKVQSVIDTRDDYFFPSSGFRASLAVESADPAMGSQISYWRFTSGFRYFKSIGAGVIMGLRYHSGLILPGRDQITLPIGERFFNGGENSVRSFRESRVGPADVSGNPVGGMGFNTINIELRRKITANFALSLFTDFGNVAPNRSRSEQGMPPYAARADVIDDTLNDFFSDFRSSVGTGIQYLLPIGPLRLDCAFNPDRREEKGEDDFVIHFSVGMAF